MHKHALKAYISAAPNEIVASTAAFHSTFIMLVVFPRYARLSRVFRRAKDAKRRAKDVLYIYGMWMRVQTIHLSQSTPFV